MLVGAEWVILSLCESLQCETQNVDTVSGGEVEFQLMRLLQKVDRQSKHLVISEWDVVFQNRQFIVPVRRFQSERRLQSAHDVVGDFES